MFSLNLIVFSHIFYTWRFDTKIYPIVPKTYKIATNQLLSNFHFHDTIAFNRSRTNQITWLSQVSQWYRENGEKDEPGPLKILITNANEAQFRKCVGPFYNFLLRTSSNRLRFNQIPLSGLTAHNGIACAVHSREQNFAMDQLSTLLILWRAPLEDVLRVRGIQRVPSSTPIKVVIDDTK